MISLAVQELAASRFFYQKLGFVAVGGDGQRWQILRDGASVIGLFQGMFPKNTLTFNPGWDAECRPLAEFTDVRELQRQLRAAGIEPVSAVDESGSGPGSFLVIDPDGNPVLVDQHV